jgi:hypothetical protein
MGQTRNSQSKTPAVTAMAERIIQIVQRSSFTGCLEFPWKGFGSIARSIYRKDGDQNNQGAP